MKCVKTRLRSLLTEENIEWVMIASSEGPDSLSDEHSWNILRGKTFPEILPENFPNIF